MRILMHISLLAIDKKVVVALTKEHNGSFWSKNMPKQYHLYFKIFQIILSYSSADCFEYLGPTYLAGSCKYSQNINKYAQKRVQKNNLKILRRSGNFSSHQCILMHSLGTKMNYCAKRSVSGTNSLHLQWSVWLNFWGKMY